MNEAAFDHMILRDRIKFNNSLQKLYEKMFFDDYDLGEACKQFDVYQDGRIVALINSYRYNVSESF